MAKKKDDVNIWIPIGVAIGLILFPEPATTATGLLILAGTFGYKVLT
jgi:hypothetical protein